MRTRRDLLRGVMATWGASAVHPLLAARGGEAPGDAGSRSQGLAIGTGPHLLLDDDLIERSDGLALVIHPPACLPGPVLGHARFGVTRPVLSLLSDPHPDQSRFRAWYRRGPGLWHAESVDGVHWSDPRPCPGLPGGDGFAVLDDREREPDPRRRFKTTCRRPSRGTLGDRRRGGERFLATSPDGMNWSLDDGPSTPSRPSPVIRGVGGAWSDHPIGRNRTRSVTIPASLGDEDQWNAGSRRASRRPAGMPSGPGFAHRSGLRTTFEADGGGDGAHPLRGIGGLHARGPLLVGYAHIVGSGRPSGPIEGVGGSALVYSRDGIRWGRPPGPTLDGNLEPGAWDHATRWVLGVLPMGDELFLYYGGRGHSADPDPGRGWQVGLARMKADRYASRSAGGPGGILRTRPFLVPGDHLTLNARTRGGEVRVRVLDETGKPYQTFDWCDGVPLVGDAVAIGANWKTGRLASLRGKVARLEFRIRDADLFGFSYRGDPS